MTYYFPMFSIFEGFELIIIWVYSGKIFIASKLIKFTFLFEILQTIDLLKINLLGLLILIYLVNVKILPFISLVPNLLQNILELFYKFILNI